MHQSDSNLITEFILRPDAVQLLIPPLFLVILAGLILYIRDRRNGTGIYMERWIELDKQVKTYLAERTIKSEHSSVMNRELYSDYRAWCETNNQSPLQNEYLARRIRDMGFNQTIREGERYTLHLQLKP